MKCTVKFKLNEISCPGTLHLQDRHPVYLTVGLFGRIQRTQHVYPSFPMVFQAKIKFQRIFTNAKKPDHVLEILEDESITIELRQNTKGHRGHGLVLASYEECARKFLFPNASKIPKEDHLKREILLSRTEHFSAGRGLDPQLVFRTKSSIEEDPIALVNTPGLTFSKQLPPSSLNHIANTTIKKKPKRRKPHNKSLPLHLSFNYSSNEEEEEEERQKQKISLKSSVKRKHCLCECKVLSDSCFDLSEWMEGLTLKENKQSTMKPFRTGKAPDELLQKRHFGSPTEEKRGSQLKFCDSCLVPSKSCVLCNAYKTVYGEESFLKHRFERYRIDQNLNSHQDTNRNVSYQATPKIKTKSPIANYESVEQLKSKSSSILQKTSKTPKSSKRKVVIAEPSLQTSHKDTIPPSSGAWNTDRFLYDPTLYSDSDDRDDFTYDRCEEFQDYYNPNKDKDDERKDFLSTTVDEYFNSKKNISSKNSASSHKKKVENSSEPIFSSTRNNSKLTFLKDYDDDINNHKSFLEESKRIHERIKTLMVKNKSALQNELSSCSSSDSYIEESYSDVPPEELDENELNDEHRSSKYSRRSPRSPVRPLTGKLWSPSTARNYREADETSREVFDSTLKSIYEDLYEKSLRKK